MNLPKSSNSPFTVAQSLFVPKRAVTPSKTIRTTPGGSFYEKSKNNNKKYFIRYLKILKLLSRKKLNFNLK